jgi:hypothetical protein
MGTKPIVATPENVGLILDRFNKFGRRISKGSNKFTLKQIWCKPTNIEDWLGSPVNFDNLGGSFIARIHPLMNIARHKDVIMGLNFTSSESLVRVTHRNDKLNNHFFTVIYLGDKIYFRNNSVIIVPKDKYMSSGKILSQFITFSDKEHPKT